MIDKLTFLKSARPDSINDGNNNVHQALLIDEQSPFLG
jgi:hypothetical protein